MLVPNSLDRTEGSLPLARTAVRFGDLMCFDIPRSTVMGEERMGYSRALMYGNDPGMGKGGWGIGW